MASVYEAPPHSHCENLLHPSDYAQLLIAHARWWATPAVVFALLAGVYTLIAPQQWKASQALIIRPEVASVSEGKLDKFVDLSEMKTTQETILELAKSQVVVQAALRDVGAPAKYRRPAEWPTALDVEAFRKCVDMRPPGGSEFGKTEVFYLTVSDSNRDRAGALVVALCNHLEQRLQALRDQSAQSMITELERTVAMADDDLSDQVATLSSFEGSVGADLAELRNLNADVGGQSEVSQVLQAIESERRANEARHDECNRLLELLVAAQNDPQQLLATPNTLLASQPSVSQLKNALISAQLRTADLLGSRNDNHPFVIAAREAESSIRAELHNEIGVAIQGLTIERQLCLDREESLAAKCALARQRLSRLAAFRAEYANLVSSVQNCTRLAEGARKNLTDARARQAGAQSASVISRIDGVEAGVRPAGPARKTVVAAGGAGGMLLGFGLVFVFAKPLTSAKAGTSETRSTAVRGRAQLERQLAGHLRSASESFGMFRGMSLQDAMRAVERRIK